MHSTASHKTEMSIKESIRVKTTNMSANRTLDFALRALQFIFAIIILGTDGHAIYLFRPHTVYENLGFEYAYLRVGVPDAWSFLLFCAAWTIVDTIFVLMVGGMNFADHRMIGYTCVFAESVAVLSWLAGFIAVAANIGSNTCPAEENGCGTIIAAAVFGALEWVLFVVTGTLTAKLALKGRGVQRSIV